MSGQLLICTVPADQRKTAGLGCLLNRVRPDITSALSVGCCTADVAMQSVQKQVAAQTNVTAGHLVDLPVEWCQDCNCEQGPEEGWEGAGLGGPLQVHTVLHPPGSDENPTEGKEEGSNGPLGL